MEFTIKIDDSLFEVPVKDAVARAVHQVVREQVNKSVSQYRNTIDSLIKKSKNEIDSAVARLIEEKLRDGEGWTE